MRQAGDFAFPDVASLGNSAGDGRVRRLTGDGELYEDVAGGWRKIRLDTLKTLTLFNTNTSFNQSVLNPVSFAADSSQFANSVLALALPPTFVTTSNTSFLLELTGKDSTTGSFRVLIVGRVLGDGGTAASWTANSVLTLVGVPPFNSVKFGMSAASPKTPMIILGDGTTALNFPTYVVDRLTIIGPTANTLYTSGTPIALSVVTQANMAATFTVQNSVSPNVLANSYASLVSNAVQAFAGSLQTPGAVLVATAGSYAVPYPAGFVGENYGTGMLVDFGANFSQLNGTINASMFGAYFRIDTRDAQASEMFSVSAVPGGSGASQGRELKVFRVDRTGNIYSTVNGYQVLTTNSTLSGAKVTGQVASINANYAATANDAGGFIFADASSAALTVTLPSAVPLSGRTITVKKKDSTANVVTLATTSSQTIDGAATRTLTTQWASVRLASDGSNWMVV